MKRRLLFVVAAMVLCTISITSAYLARSRAAPAPKSLRGLVTPNPTVDFGDVRQGEVKRARFTLTNHYSQPVRFTGVHTSCNCTNASVNPPVLSPGETTEVTADWNVGPSRGATRILLSLNYRLEDGREGNIPLNIKGVALPDYRVEPATLFFDARAGLQSQTVSFHPALQPDCYVTGATATHRAFLVKHSRTQVEVIFNPEHWPEEDGRTVQLVLETNSPRQASCTVALTVKRNDRP